MPLQPIQIPEDTGIGYLIILALTILGTLARISYNFVTGHPMTLMFVLAQISISIFASALAFMVAVWFSWKVMGVSISVGLAAWLGVTFIVFIEKRLLKRMKGNQDDSKSS